MDKWQEFEKLFFRNEKLGLSVDFSKVGFQENFFDEMSEKVLEAHREMAALEAGAIANTDENRMVGHYWLRDSAVAPQEELKKQIDEEISKTLKFASQVHFGTIVGQDGPFENALFIGIGGSSLGPQLICESLRSDRDKINCFFIDNTDPDGIDLVLRDLAGKLGKTLVVVTSKSGSTPEPRNAMLEVRAAYEEAGYSFCRHAVAITGANSLLAKQADEEKWLDRFLMWDWVGGRTSVFSVVGLLPAALQGRSVELFVSGGREMDRVTRQVSTKNPAMLLALAWHFASDGCGKKDMVVLPYKDRLSNFSKYLQQLIMESLGKKADRDGREVRQGLTVYGNKGSTDQHSFIQQLRDGVRNFFITVVNVLESSKKNQVAVDKMGMTSGDYLNGFALGTILALEENGTSIIQISIDKFSEHELGALIALYERAVGFYASLINVNAYHQPGVEAGKKAAEKILNFQKLIVNFLAENPGQAFSVPNIAEAINLKNDPVLVFKILEHLRGNGQAQKINGETASLATYKSP